MRGDARAVPPEGEAREPGSRGTPPGEEHLCFFYTPAPGQSQSEVARARTGTEPIGRGAR